MLRGTNYLEWDLETCNIRKGIHFEQFRFSRDNPDSISKGGMAHQTRWTSVTSWNYARAIFKDLRRQEALFASFRLCAKDFAAGQLPIAILFLFFGPTQPMPGFSTKVSDLLYVSQHLAHPKSTLPNPNEINITFGSLWPGFEAQVELRARLRLGPWV